MEPPSTPLPGAVVRILQGAGAGMSVVTEVGGGVFRDLQIPGGSLLLLEAQEDGYESFTEEMYIGSSGPDGRCDRLTAIELGQPPHIFYGYAEENGLGRRKRLAAVRVELLDGPNQGATAVTDDAGYFRIDGLVTSGPFAFRCIAPGYTTVVVQNYVGIRRNTGGGCGLFPQ
jgi:hypothetical protein